MSQKVDNFAMALESCIDGLSNLENFDFHPPNLCGDFSVFFTQFLSSESREWGGELFVAFTFFSRLPSPFQHEDLIVR